MGLAWAAALLVAVGSARGQISLSSAVDLALRNDPRVKMAQADVLKAQSSLRETHDAFVPAVGLEAGDGKSTGAPLGLPTAFNLSAQSLLFSFSQIHNIRGARAGLESAQFALREASEQVAEDTVVTYLDLDNAQRRSAAMREEYAVATQLTTILQERLDAGVENRIELLKVQRTAAQVRVSSLNTEAEVMELSEHLSGLLGMGSGKLTTVSESIPAIPEIRMPEAEPQLSAGVQSALENAKSKQEIAYGASRYRYLPQVLLFENFSELDTSPSASKFLQYYPAFQGQQTLSAGIAFQAQFPLFDRGREDRGREAIADAQRARYEAEHQRTQFLEGRSKLRHSIEVLQAKSELAKLDRDLAQAQLEAVTTQLSASSGSSDAPQMTPKDEQNSRLQERERYVELLQSELELRQAEVNLLRQTGQLEGWLKLALRAPLGVPTSVSKP